MEDKIIIDGIEFTNAEISKMLTPEVMDEIFGELSEELTRDLIFHAKIKYLEDIEDSVFKDNSDDKTKADELWERIAYLEVEKLLGEYESTHSQTVHMLYSISADDKMRFRRNRDSCRNKPKCAFFIGDYSDKSLSKQKCKNRLRKAIYNAISCGYNIFIVGLFTRAELWAAEELQKFCRKNSNIRVIYATLYDGYEYDNGLNNFDKSDIKLYQNIIQSADNIRYFFKKWEPKKYAQNEFLWQDNVLAYLWMMNFAQKGIGLFGDPDACLKKVLNSAIKSGMHVENWLHCKYDKSGKPQTRAYKKPGKSKVVSIFGDTSELLVLKLDFSEQKDKIEEQIRFLLQGAIDKTIDNGSVQFIIKMTRGVALWAAEEVLKYRKENPSIKLICVVPFKGIEEKWLDSDKLLYQKILQQSDKVKYISKSYSPDCMNLSNKYIIDNSCQVLSAYADFHGGIRNTLKYAMKQRKIIDSIILSAYYEYDC